MLELWQLGRQPDVFPPTRNALSNPNGLLAVGGDLSIHRLRAAYARGIFPWYEQGQPILWWSPDPRMVLAPDKIHVSRSLQKFLRRSTWTVSVDRCFDLVVQGCAGLRNKSQGTWITPDMQQAYGQLHAAGVAHSIEVFDGNALVGGLYGVALGRVFFGESMFSCQSNASKTAFISLARWLRREGFVLIDCQVANPHLQSLGATEMPRNLFEINLSANTTPSLIDAMQPIWQHAQGKLISRDGRIIS